MRYRKADLVESLRQAAEGATKGSYLVLDDRRQRFLMARAQFGVNRGWLKAVWSRTDPLYACWKLYFTKSGLAELQGNSQSLNGNDHSTLNLVLGYPVDPAIRAQLSKLAFRCLPRFHRESAQHPCHWCHLKLWVPPAQEKWLHYLFAENTSLGCPFCTVSLLKQGSPRIHIV